MTQQTTFSIPPPIFILAPAPAPATIDPDLMDYRLYRKNAIWFIQRTDGYTNGFGHTYVEIPEGHSKKCAEKYFAKCLDLSIQLSVRDVALGHISTASNSSANDATSPSAVTECLCIDCLRIDLDRLFLLRK
jgi:hypothetical protein